MYLKCYINAGSMNSADMPGYSGFFIADKKAEPFALGFLRHQREIQHNALTQWAISDAKALITRIIEGRGEDVPDNRIKDAILTISQELKHKVVEFFTELEKGHPDFNPTYIFNTNDSDMYNSLTDGVINYRDMNKEVKQWGKVTDFNHFPRVTPKGGDLGLLERLGKEKLVISNILRGLSVVEYMEPVIDALDVLTLAYDIEELNLIIDGLGKMYPDLGNALGNYKSIDDIDHWRALMFNAIWWINVKNYGRLSNPQFPLPGRIKVVKLEQPATDSSSKQKKEKEDNLATATAVSIDLFDRGLKSLANGHRVKWVELIQNLQHTGVDIDTVWSELIKRHPRLNTLDRHQHRSNLGVAASFLDTLNWYQENVHYIINDLETTEAAKELLKPNQDKESVMNNICTCGNPNCLNRLVAGKLRDPAKFPFEMVFVMEPGIQAPKQTSAETPDYATAVAGELLDLVDSDLDLEEVSTAIEVKIGSIPKAELENIIVAYCGDDVPTRGQYAKRLRSVLYGLVIGDVMTKVAQKKFDDASEKLEEQPNEIVLGLNQMLVSWVVNAENDDPRRVIDNIEPSFHQPLLDHLVAVTGLKPTDLDDPKVSVRDKLVQCVERMVDYKKFLKRTLELVRQRTDFTIDLEEMYIATAKSPKSLELGGDPEDWAQQLVTMIKKSPREVISGSTLPFIEMMSEPGQKVVLRILGSDEMIQKYQVQSLLTERSTTWLLNQICIDLARKQLEAEEAPKFTTMEVPTPEKGHPLPAELFTTAGLNGGVSIGFNPALKTTRFTFVDNLGKLKERQAIDFFDYLGDVAAFEKWVTEVMSQFEKLEIKGVHLKGSKSSKEIFKDVWGDSNLVGFIKFANSLDNEDLAEYLKDAVGNIQMARYLMVREITGKHLMLAHFNK